MSISQWGRVLVDEIEGAEVPPGELWAWPLGGASLAVRSAEATIYIDPYTGSPEASPWLRMVAVPYDPSDLRQVDAVFSTHDHDDHCHEATLAPIVANTAAPLVGPASSARKMRGWGLPYERVVEATDGDVFRFGDMTVKAAEIIDHSDPTSLGWLVRANDGPTLFDGGDGMYGDYFARIGAREPVTAATLSVAGLLPDDGRKIYMDADDAVRAAVDLAAAVLIPKHWDLWRNVRMDPWEVVVAAHARRAQFCVHIPRLGEVIRLRRS